MFKYIWVDSAPQGDIEHQIIVLLSTLAIFLKRFLQIINIEPVKILKIEGNIMTYSSTFEGIELKGDLQKILDN